MIVRTQPIQAVTDADTLTQHYGDYIDDGNCGGQMLILEMFAIGIKKANGVVQVVDYLSVKPTDNNDFGDE